MDITRTIRGKRVAAVMTNGTTLAIQCEDGSEILVRWVNDNGEPIKGRPVVSSRGFRMKVADMQDIIQLPAGA